MLFSLGEDEASLKIFGTKLESRTQHGVCNTNSFITTPSQRDNRVQSISYHIVPQQRSRHS